MSNAIFITAYGHVRLKHKCWYRNGIGNCKRRIPIIIRQSSRPIWQHTLPTVNHSLFRVVPKGLFLTGNSQLSIYVIDGN